MKLLNLMPEITQPAVWQLHKEWRALQGGVNEFGLDAMVCQAASQLRASKPGMDALDALTQATMRATALRDAAQGNHLFQDARAVLNQTRGKQAKLSNSQAGQ